jgi:hypothetical protein
MSAFKLGAMVAEGELGAVDEFVAAEVEPG